MLYKEIKDKLQTATLPERLKTETAHYRDLHASIIKRVNYIDNEINHLQGKATANNMSAQAIEYKWQLEEIIDVLML